MEREAVLSNYAKWSKTLTIWRQFVIDKLFECVWPFYGVDVWGVKIMNKATAQRTKPMEFLYDRTMKFWKFITLRNTSVHTKYAELRST